MTDTIKPPSAPGVPALTLGWRMKMALDFGGVAAHEMAAELGVTRQTVARWMNVDGVPVRPAFLKQWALRCGVDYDWLVAGETTARVSHQKPRTLTAAA